MRGTRRDGIDSAGRTTCDQDELQVPAGYNIITYLTGQANSRVTQIVVSSYPASRTDGSRGADTQAGPGDTSVTAGRANRWILRTWVDSDSDRGVTVRT